MGRERERSMRQSGRYAESNVNPNMVGQMLHSTQRMHMTSGPGMSQLQGRSDSFQPDDEHQYTSSNLEAQWQWDRNGSRGPPSSHGYSEGQLNASRSPFQGKWSDSRQSLERKIHPDSENMIRQKEVNARYDDSALPQTFEGLEQKFVDDISKLAKDQYDAEDAENARHVQRLTEINTQYQEKLSAMRIRQAADRDDFLRKESQSRLHEYQQGKMNSYNKPISVPSDYIGYPISGGYDDREAHRAAAYDNRAQANAYNDSRIHANAYHDQAQFSAADTRGPYPGGRAYNSGGRRF